MKVQISGTKAAVDEVDEERVIGVIDMDKVFEGLGMEEWQAGSYTGEIVFDFKLPEGLEVTPNNSYALTVELRENTEDESAQNQENQENEESGPEEAGSQRYE